MKPTQNQESALPPPLSAPMGRCAWGMHWGDGRWNGTKQDDLARAVAPLTPRGNVQAIHRPSGVRFVGMLMGMHPQRHSSVHLLVLGVVQSRLVCASAHSACCELHAPDLVIPRRVAKPPSRQSLARSISCPGRPAVGPGRPCHSTPRSIESAAAVGPARTTTPTCAPRRGSREVASRAKTPNAPPPLRPPRESGLTRRPRRAAARRSAICRPTTSQARPDEEEMRRVRIARRAATAD